MGVGAGLVEVLDDCGIVGGNGAGGGVCCGGVFGVADEEVVEFGGDWDECYIVLLGW